MDLKTAKELSKNIKHVAFIMDGNRRWAVQNGKNKLDGHKFGVKALLNILKYQKELGIKTTTFYALSRDNKAKRGADEYNSLMDLFLEYFEKLKNEIQKANIENEPKAKVSIFGDFEHLREDVAEKMKDITEKTKDYNDFYINFCINYDGQHEIVTGVKNVIKQIKNGNLNIDNLDEKTFKQYLFTKDFAPPEIIVRTGNMPRLSGFLLWDSQYSEIFFSPKMWPDFNEKDLYEVIESFSKIKRKFGK